MRHTGTCVHCGNDYTRARPIRGITCSPNCRAVYHRRRRESRVCIGCGETYECKPAYPTVYCSIQCFNKQPRKIKPDMFRDCSQCGNKFKRHAGAVKQIFCSVRCARFCPELTNVQCKGCNTTFKPNKASHIYCTRACRHKTKAKERRAAGWMPAGERRLALLQEFGSCERCGYIEEAGILELHHKDRNRRNNARNNTDLICPTCHTMDHYAALDGQFWSGFGKIGKKTGNKRKDKQLLLDRGAFCAICGWCTEPQILELHHKDRNHENNDPNNTELLCPNCHALDHFLAQDGPYLKKKKHYSH